MEGRKRRDITEITGRRKRRRRKWAKKVSGWFTSSENFGKFRHANYLAYTCNRTHVRREISSAKFSLDESKKSKNYTEQAWIDIQPISVRR